MTYYNEKLLEEDLKFLSKWVENKNWNIIKKKFMNLLHLIKQYMLCPQIKIMFIKLEKLDLMLKKEKPKCKLTALKI